MQQLCCLVAFTWRLFSISDKSEVCASFPHSTDLKTSVVSHVVTDGAFFTAIVNVHRRELITADSDGGLKAWALRASTSSAAAAGGLKGILRVHTATGAVRMHFELYTLRLGLNECQLIAHIPPVDSEANVPAVLPQCEWAKDPGKHNYENSRHRRLHMHLPVELLQRTVVYNRTNGVWCR